MYCMMKLAIFLILVTLPKFQAEDKFITTSFGSPVPYKDSSITIGERGPIPLDDVVLIDELAHFDRERIPERVAHAKGSGAFGYFEVTDDITRYSAAVVFSEIGKNTTVAVRMSTTAGESGSSDTENGLRGFSVKHYTEEGIWDMVGINFPVFVYRDPIFTTHSVHSGKRNPQTHLRDPNMAWDFLTLRQQGVNQIMYSFSGLGTPDGYRHMDGFSANTFSLINDTGHMVFTRFHYRTDQGIKNLPLANATALGGTNPDYATKDLYDAIESGNFPSWTVYIQVMTREESLKTTFNPFDVTKLWPENEFPLIRVGKLVLNRNPLDYFSDVEQIALSPSNVIPGIGFSPDRVLAGRIFSYPDTQRYRLGANFNQLPINCPFQIHNYLRDGTMAYDNQGNATNYHPNSHDQLKISERARRLSPSYHIDADATWYDTGDDDNFSQATVRFNSWTDDEKEVFYGKMTAGIRAARRDIQIRVADMMGKVHQDIKDKLVEAFGLSDTSS